MPIIIIDEVEGFVIDFGGEAERVFRGGGGGWGAEGGVGIVDGGAGGGNEVGDVFVAVVEIVGDFTP